MLVFHGKNLFRSLESKHNDHVASKSSYYRFLTIRKPTRILTTAPTAGKPGWKVALCEDVQDMELSDALRSLMSLFMETINGYGTEDTETIKSKMSNWICQPEQVYKGVVPEFMLGKLSYQ